MNCPACSKPIPPGFAHVCPECWRQVPGKRRVYFYTLVTRKQPFQPVLDQIVTALKAKWARESAQCPPASQQPAVPVRDPSAEFPRLGA